MSERVTAADVQERGEGLQRWAAERELVAYQNFLRRMLEGTMPAVDVDRVVAGATAQDVEQLFYPLIGRAGSPAGSILTDALLVKA